MDFADLKNKSERQLHELLNETRDKLRDLRFKAGDRQLKDVSKIRTTRKTIARILTLLNMDKQEEKKSKNKRQNHK